jgi:hypothetical protein
MRLLSDLALQEQQQTGAAAQASKSLDMLSRFQRLLHFFRAHCAACGISGFARTTRWLM